MGRNGRVPRLLLTTGKRQGVHLLAVSGEVDLAAQTEFREALEKAVAGANSPLIIDLSGVRFIDASGFSALIATQKKMTARPDKLYVIVDNPFIRRLFSILGLDTFFDLRVSVNAAIAAAVKARNQGLALAR
jgi:anti-sigma B factor antagonist